MIRLAVVALSVSALSCCASSPPLSGPEPERYPTPDLSGVLRIMGNTTGGHLFAAQACPLSATLAITNTHVTVGGSLLWDAAGVSGHIDPSTLGDQYRDLTAVRPVGTPFPRSYPLSEAAPVPGDRVWFVGYDYRKVKDAYKPRVMRAEVVNVVAGVVFYTPSGIRGSSGSCVLNERGEVVAINRGGGDLDNGDVIGMGVGVWGDRIKPIKASAR
jgi:hypothetical protein